MKYFLTGATGFLGGRIARQLREAGHDVVALVRRGSAVGDLERIGGALAEGDVTARESMRGAMTGVDGVFHCAGWYKIGSHERWIAESVNVGGTRNVLEVMKELGIPKGVYTSTLAVNSHTRGMVVDESYRYFGQHLSVYDETKWRAHYEVAEPMMKTGLPLVIVQPGLVYGPGDTSLVAQTLRQYLLGKLPAAPRGTAFCFAHVDDVARAHLLAMEKGKPGANYFICGPPMSFIEVLHLCERISDRKAPRVYLPPLALKTFSAAMRVVEQFVRVPETASAEALNINAGTTYLGSDAKARRELGFSTRPLEEGLRETLRYEMERLGMSFA